MLPSLHWPSLVAAAGALGVTLPETVDAALAADEAFQRALHHVLFDVHVLEGELVCGESGQVFPITEGIPDMTIAEELAA